MYLSDLDRVSCLYILDLNLSVHVCHPAVFYLSTELAGVQWIWKLIVMRISWPGHPELYIKKKVHRETGLVVLL
jgi:hypothetical protein